MSKTPEEKRVILVQRTAAALGVSEAEAVTLLSQNRAQSLRLNPLAGSTRITLAQLEKLGWQGKPYGWVTDCYTLDTPLEQIRDSKLAAEGKVYIQNAASWLPVLALDPQPGDYILDVCAAPGGKASHIAAITRNRAHITANDNSRPRLAKMQANFTRLHVQNVQTTLFDGAQLARQLSTPQFDKILLDAPCSGEGMMQLTRDKDFTTWSVAHIKRLQQLQKRIITQAWQLLRPGGTMVYSTCTMAPEENEAIIEYILRSREGASTEAIQLQLPNRMPPVAIWNNKTYDPRIAGCMRLKPSLHIEAFFICKLKKVAPTKH